MSALQDRGAPTTRDTCGTLAGYRTHVGAGERACRACAEAWAQYMREYRHNRAPQDVLDRASVLGKARGRALTRLSRLHPVEYAELLAEEKSRGGMA